MKKIYLYLIFVLILLCFNNSVAQSTGINYSFTQTGSSMIYNSSSAGAVTIIPGGADDVVATFTVPATWSGFFYGSRWIPQSSTVTVSSNGWLSFSNQGSALPINSLSSTPMIIAPLWDDLKIDSAGKVSSQDNNY